MINIRGYWNEQIRPLHSNALSSTICTRESCVFQISPSILRSPTSSFSRISTISAARFPASVSSSMALTMTHPLVEKRISEGEKHLKIEDIE